VQRVKIQELRFDQSSNQKINQSIAEPILFAFYFFRVFRAFVNPGAEVGRVLAGAQNTGAPIKISVANEAANISCAVRISFSIDHGALAAIAAIH